ncbi:MAG: aminotransferase class IV [Roseovarius sp.]
MSKDFTQGAAWIRGEILPIAEATIGVTDWALTHSDVTYDVVPVWEGAFFRLPDYLDRFEASMQACRMEVGLTRTDIETALNAMVARSGLRAAYCAMVAARGAPLIPGSRDPRECANHFYAWCVPYVHVLTPQVAEAGAKLLLPDDIRRIPEDSVDPRAKNYHWGDFTQGLFAAKDRGLDNVVLADHAGNVTEGPGFNIFALKNGTVITPDRGVLEGITRCTVLDLAREAGLQTEERPLPVAELMQADEVFLSTSGGGVVPVAQINDRSFSNGCPGPIGTSLRKSYFERLQDPAFRTEITYDTA